VATVAALTPAKLHVFLPRGIVNLKADEGHAIWLL
jgi:hypothetical protein